MFARRPSRLALWVRTASRRLQAHALLVASGAPLCRSLCKAGSQLSEKTLGARKPNFDMPRAKDRMHVCPLQRLNERNRHAAGLAWHESAGERPRRKNSHVAVERVRQAARLSKERDEQGALVGVAAA